MLLSNFAICGTKKSRFIKGQIPKRISSSPVFKTPLSKIPLLGDILFQNYKMNEIVNKFLLAGNRCTFEVHLKQPGFTYSACGKFTKNTERIQKFKETGDKVLRQNFKK